MIWALCLFLGFLLCLFGMVWIIGVGLLGIVRMVVFLCVFGLFCWEVLLFWFVYFGCLIAKVLGFYRRFALAFWVCGV